MSALADYRQLYDAGERALRVGSGEEARGLFEQATAAAANDAEAAEALCQLGRALATLGRHAEADAALAQALERAGDSQPALARARLQLGVVRWMRGDLKAAREYLEQAVADCRRLGLVRDHAAALGNLGSVLFTVGEYRGAMDAFRQCITLHESLSDLARVAINCNNLGECYLELGAYGQAREHFQRCLNLAGLLDSPALAIDATRNLGRVQALDGELDLAPQTIGESIALAERYLREYLRTQALATLAEVRRQRGELDAAEAIGQELVASGDAAAQRAEALLVLGRCALARGDGQQALALLEQGLLEAEASFRKIVILHFHAALAGIVDQPAIAQVHQRIALELVEQIGDSLDDRDLQQSFRASPLVAALLA
jgi:tetratricopeptide (TPR) repeat protein